VNPFAVASNVLYEPSGDKRSCSLVAAVVAGPMIRLVPPRIAPSQPPLCNARQASCGATSEAEQPVSMNTIYR
jgi:hypothetical protein